MAKLHQHDDPKVDAEMENIYSRTDLYLIDINTPKNPRTGTMWFNPSDGKLKIFKTIQSGWESIN